MILADTSAWVEYDRATGSVRHGAALLAQDVDVVRVAGVLGLTLDAATPR